jgi:hypothetical protein
VEYRICGRLILFLGNEEISCFLYLPREERDIVFPVLVSWRTRLFLLKGPAADATDAPQPWRLIVQPYEEYDEDDEVFSAFLFNGALVEWNWQGKTEVLGEKPVPVTLCPPQIPHVPTNDRTRASAVRGRRLTAWAIHITSKDET